MSRNDDIVRHIARQLANRAPAGVDIRDLLRVGRAALEQARLSFDDSDARDFESHLSVQVRRAMLDLLEAEPFSVSRRFRGLWGNRKTGSR